MRLSDTAYETARWASPAPSATLPDSNVEDTRVAGSPDSRDTTIA